MLHVYEPVARPTGANRLRRSPAIPVTCAVMVGIVADRSMGLSLFNWLLLTSGLVVLVVIAMAQRWRVASVSLLLLSCMGLGGAWHHWRWSCFAENDVFAWATENGQRVRLLAKIRQSPLIARVPDADHTPWRASERTLTVVDCVELKSETAPSELICGRARLAIDGRCEDLAIGDVVEITGEVVRPAVPSNPGGFDARHWLRAQGLHAIIAAESTDAVRIVSRERTLIDRLATLRANARRRAEQLIANHLSPRTAAVAQSLLLGSRVDLDRDVRRAFAESGTLHVLAISGMNVGLLWSWLWIISRCLRRSTRFSLAIVLMLLPAYAILTDANPPVVRATLVAVALALGQLAGRAVSPWNSLALAALFVLAWNPTDLFNSGAQLSFLSVFAILIALSFVRPLQQMFDDADQPFGGAPLWRSGLAWLMQKIVESYAIGTAIWLLTSPLIASEFHLVSPVGLILNVLLSPLIVVMFWLGYSFLLLGLASSSLFGWLGVPFDLTLGWFLSAVEASARTNLGHLYVPAPQTWWLIGFYIVIVWLALRDQIRGRLFWSTRAALAWAVIGMALSLRTTSPSGVTCTVISVGHGLSVLIECPNGRTLLYDAGGMTGGNRVAQTVSEVLWSTGRSRLDAIVVSHADADHCNALPEMMEVLPTRTLFVHRTFLDWSQPPVASTLDKAADAGVAIRLLAAGQSMALDPEVTLRVLHPAPDYHAAKDNPNSIVLCLEYAGRRILLTGDLEREGLERLLRTPRVDTDVLLAPHHGSIKANTTDLARWATPEWVIASASDPNVEERLATRYGPAAHVLSTARRGAIRCRISAEGDLSVEPYRR